MKLHLPLLTFLICSSLVYAQKPFKDYLINKNGDTVQAKIRYNLMGKIVYKLTNDSSSHPVDTVQFKAYHWSKQKPYDFIVLGLPDLGKKSFVGILEKGRINLYQRTVHGKNSTSYWYASKGAQVFEINNQRRLFGVDPNLKHNFELLINDNYKISAEFKTTKNYNIKIIRELIKGYNAKNI